MIEYSVVNHEFGCPHFALLAVDKLVSISEFEFVFVCTELLVIPYFG